MESVPRRGFIRSLPEFVNKLVFLGGWVYRAERGWADDFAPIDGLTNGICCETRNVGDQALAAGRRVECCLA